MQKVNKYRLAIGGLTLALAAVTAAFVAQRFNNANLNDQLRLVQNQLSDASVHAASDAASTTALSRKLVKEGSDAASERVRVAATIGAFARQAVACEAIMIHHQAKVETDDRS